MAKARNRSCNLMVLMLRPNHWPTSHRKKPWCPIRPVYQTFWKFGTVKAFPHVKGKKIGKKNSRPKSHADLGRSLSLFLETSLSIHCWLSLPLFLICRQNHLGAQPMSQKAREVVLEDRNQAHIIYKVRFILLFPAHNNITEGNASNQSEVFTTFTCPLKMSECWNDSEFENSKFFITKL